jgi:hypothetical protein
MHAAMKAMMIEICNTYVGSACSRPPKRKIMPKPIAAHKAIAPTAKIEIPIPAAMLGERSERIASSSQPFMISDSHGRFVRPFLYFR